MRLGKNSIDESGQNLSANILENERQEGARERAVYIIILAST